MTALTPLLLAALLWVPAGTLTCIGDSGQPVDWFVIYKLPVRCNDDTTVPEDLPADCRGDVAVPDGLRYKYLDNSSSSWQDGLGPISSSQGALGLSLKPLYESQASQLAFLLYNDQPPSTSETDEPPLTSETDQLNNPNKSDNGHAKGLVLLDQNGGFWLVHSVPRFPPRAKNGAYRWPPNALRFGQTLLCVSFPLNQFRNIGKQLTYINPLVYDSQLGTNFKTLLPELVDVIQGNHVLQPPWNRSVALTTTNGATFRSFAKFTEFKDDLYAGWLAGALGSNLQVQFWRRSVMPSDCSGPYHVFDVTRISFPGGPSYNSTKDHSKWCVASQQPWSCVSDLNRNYGGYLRSGGALCAQMPNLWDAFKSLVARQQPCPHGSISAEDLGQPPNNDL